MSLNFLTKSFPRWRNGRPLSAQVGIDLGTYAIKLAGLRREGTSWHREFQMLLPHDPLTDWTNPAGSTSALGSRLPLQSGWRKRKSACVSSMSFVSFRQFSLPAGSDEELRGMVEAELLSSAEDDLEILFDFWQADIAEREPNALRTVSVISMPQHQGEAVARDLMQAGFLCQVHDGLPFALARAVQLANPQAKTPIAALDLGASAATWVVCHRGLPQYTRILRGCEISKAASALASQLGLSADAAWTFLAEPAEHIGANLAARREEGVRLILGEIIAEATRTFEYVKNQMRGGSPQAVQLFGVGGMVPLIANTLARSLPVPVQPWRLDADSKASLHDPLYGAAYAMSAWGEQS